MDHATFAELGGPMARSDGPYVGATGSLLSSFVISPTEIYFQVHVEFIIDKICSRHAILPLNR